MDEDIKREIYEFVNYFKKGEVEVYNEYSLQFEIGWFLKSRLGSKYKVQVEKKVRETQLAKSMGIDKKSLIKSRMDIYIWNTATREQLAIELKFPRAGQVPIQIYQFFKDVKFLEQLKDHYGFSRGYSVVFVDDKNFYEGEELSEPVYEYFRTKKVLPGFTTISIPVGMKKGDGRFSLTKDYPIEWKDINDRMKYYILEV
jgi:hypothetical protein